MATTTKNNSKDLLSAILAILAVIFAVAFISKIIKDLKKSADNDIVSDEGKDILSNPEKRKILRSAIDEYHQNGNWKGLSKLKP